MQGQFDATLRNQKSRSPQMFDRIAARYDLVNRILSCGLDQGWRRRVIHALGITDADRVLDCATGTGDMLLSLDKKVGPRGLCIGQDKSPGMLNSLRRKYGKIEGTAGSKCCCSDMVHLPFPDRSFTCVTIAFGIRNVPEPLDALKETFRVLTAGGRMGILEFSQPSNLLIRLGHLLFLQTVVPLIGGIISGRRHAYSYLSQTIRDFPYGERFLTIMKNAGYSDLSFQPLSGGIVTFYSGYKAPSSLW